MSLAKISISQMLLLLSAFSVIAQSEKQRSVENSFRGVELSVVSQRCLPQDEVPYVGEDVVDFSDMVARYRLENQGKEDVYYLADNVSSSIAPAGFVLFRKAKGAEWEASYTPARGREGIFTGDGYRWVLLPPGTVIEFECSDMSRNKGEHSVSVFLNTEPKHKNRVELISGAFIPNECPQGDK